MLVKLTKERIDRTPPDPAKDVFLWDSKVTGFGVKVTKKGRKVFVIQYRNARHKSRRLTFSTTALMSLDKARDEARRKLQQVRDGIDPATARDERVAEPTLGEVIATWQAEYADKNLTMKPSWPNTEKRGEAVAGVARGSGS
jgi:Arm domain-containing DNA-binding protein